MKITLDPELTANPDYIATNSTGRGIWINLLLWCAEQENGGLIPGAATWSDEAWGMLGVAKVGLAYAGRLCRAAGDDIRVWGYPIEQEDYLRRARELGRQGGLARSKVVNNSRDPIRPPSRDPIKIPTQDDAEWLAALKVNPAYEGINITVEHLKCGAWCQANGKIMSRRRFINWLNKTDRPMRRPNNGALMK